MKIIAEHDVVNMLSSGSSAHLHRSATLLNYTFIFIDSISRVMFSWFWCNTSV